MENTYMEQENKGSVLRGLLGALIGALLGAIVWGVVGILTQRVFSLLGILLGFLTAKGYELLKGRDGVIKIVIVIVCVVLSVVLGEAIYNAVSLHQVYMDGVEEVAAELATYGIDLKTLLKENPAEAYDKYLYTELEMFQTWLSEKEVQSDLIKGLGQALLFAAIGAVAVIVDLSKKKQAEAPSITEAAVPQNESDNDISPEA